MPSPVTAFPTVLHGMAIVGPDGPVGRSLTMIGAQVSEAVAEPQAWALRLDGHLAFPGFVNAHEHLHLNCVPPLVSEAPFANAYEWAEAMHARSRTPEGAAALSNPLEARYWQGALKNLLSGATLVAHHDAWNPVFDHDDFPVRVLRECAWCHSLDFAPDERPRLAVGRRLVRAALRLVGLGLPSRLPTFGPAVRGSFAATPPEQPWMIHLAEGTDAAAQAELGRLAAMGCLAANTVLIHGVGLTPADVSNILARRAALVWCPTSNTRLLGRTIDPRPFLGRGRLALGTDSRLSGARDLLEEVRAAAASGAEPSDVLRLITTGGRDVLAVRDAGTLQVGARADLVIVREQAGEEAARTVLRTARGDIRAVVRGGRPAIADPDLKAWFERAGVDAVEVTLDGHAKLLDRRYARAGAVALEPGLEFA